MQAINHGVVLIPPDTNDARHKSGTPSPTIRINDDAPVRSLEADGIDSINSKLRFNGGVWTNKRVTEFVASRTTPAAFQSGQHNRWLAAETCGESAAVVFGWGA